ncbi:MAG TPA: hypothetical protein VLA74_12355 [Nitrososphaeraceae archaeon]|nr:hypothetical protein [Nitrososphaeraceae archaeon]
MDNNLIKNNKDTNTDNNSLAGIEGGNIDLSTSKTISILNQLQPQVREELSKHDWEIISYNPTRFLIAHSEHKQIIFAELKGKDVTRRKNNIVGATIENESNETISYLKFSRIVIGAIPVEITLNKNPLGLFDHKFTIRFVTPSELSFTVGPKTLDEIVSYLKDRSLVYMTTKATEALSIIINAFEKNGKVIVINDVDTPGFYFMEGKVKNYHTNHPKPTFDQIVSCCELLDILQTKFKNKDVFPTVLKWSIISPFDYILKQVHKKWIPWLYPYGWSNTGKSTLGDICCCIWNRYHDKDAILPFTSVDTKAKLGEALSKSIYPIVINEVAQLNDEYRNKEMIEMIKTSITDLISRKKFVNKTIYTEIPSFSPCILTGNSAPPSDTGFRRRIIPIVFTEKDQYSNKEIEDFKKLFDERIKKELSVLGDFTANYILENQSLLLDGKKEWKEIAEIILTGFYNSTGIISAPEWIKYFVKEDQIGESKEEIDLLFRSYLINKVNETYNKYYRNIEKINQSNSESNAEIPNLPFSDRLNFCLKHNLIPFLNLIETDETDMIAITSDLIHEMKKNISQISSLNEIAAIIEGFEYGQKRVGGKNVRSAFGTRLQLLNFLGME